MKKIFLLLLLVLTPFAAKASEVDLIISGSEGGGMATLSKVLVPYFEKDGYSVNLTITGNCATAKKIYENSGNPSIVAWASSFLFTDNPCAVEKPTEETMFAIWNHAPAYFCVSPGFENALDSGEPIRVGTHYPSGLPQYVTNALTDYNPNIKLVYYKGSSNIQSGVVSGEVDAILSDRGMWMQENGHVNCIFNTSLKNKNGTSPIGNKINNASLSYEFMVYAYTYNMPEKMRDRLLETFQSALKSPDLVNHYNRENWDSYIQQTTTKEQLDFFNKNMP